MDQDIRTAFQTARRCVARISFCRNSKPRDIKYMVIPGIIVSVDDNKVATMVCDPVCFGFKDCDGFSVALPTAAGYEEPQHVSPQVAYWDNFVTFSLQLRRNDFVRAARFETRSLNFDDCVDAFYFPRKSYVTPACYAKGSISYATKLGDGVHVLFQNCSFHEYAYLGAPLFNRKGDLVGITYADMGSLIAWNVWQIRKNVLQHLNGIAYVLDGAPT